ncbi:uncharacterized protein BDR25DRAFT_281546 [Lindgomyces ingoldianus]|uniref:Uncharacterized protein n=1 Tax=Lindgomyces ingoldianus TaxID=673940 RepID=A0ACB6R315_9PLEO|nr:uncharacterized protein BDR25DRAFT_281546 [Lindgomyces ingoldianus]KAF2473649.1 hypothetical protein BDR25DRAFT_281546 [Lindgomyces ingoldianus]
MTYNFEAERPLIERSSSTSYNSPLPGSKRKRAWAFFRFLHFFGGGIYAPGASVHDPIEILLNEEDQEEQDRLTQIWRDNRLSELSFVGIVSALLAGVLTSTGSWPNILPNGMESPWRIRASFYCGIVLSLFSILTAADQTIRLHRLSSHRDGWKNIRNLLAKENSNRRFSNRTRRRLPSPLHIWTWQMPVMFLTTAAFCMIVGMFLHVWSATTRLDNEDWWNENSKVAVTFSIVAVLSIFFFFFGQVMLTTPDTDRD